MQVAVSDLLQHFGNMTSNKNPLNFLVMLIIFSVATFMVLYMQANDVEKIVLLRIIHKCIRLSISITLGVITLIIHNSVAMIYALLNFMRVHRPSDFPAETEDLQYHAYALAVLTPNRWFFIGSLLLIVLCLFVKNNFNAMYNSNMPLRAPIGKLLIKIYILASVFLTIYTLLVFFANRLHIYILPVNLDHFARPMVYTKILAIFSNLAENCTFEFTWLLSVFVSIIFVSVLLVFEVIFYMCVVKHLTMSLVLFCVPFLLIVVVYYNGLKNIPIKSPGEPLVAFNVRYTPLSQIPQNFLVVSDLRYIMRSFCYHFGLWIGILVALRWIYGDVCYDDIVFAFFVTYPWLMFEYKIYHTLRCNADSGIIKYDFYNIIEWCTLFRSLQYHIVFWFLSYNIYIHCLLGS